MGATDVVGSATECAPSAYDTAIAIRFSVCYRPAEFREVIAAFGSGDIVPDAMMGPQLDLDRITDAFDLVRNAGVHGRVLIAPDATLQRHRGIRRARWRSSIRHSISKGCPSP